MRGRRFWQASGWAAATIAGDIAVVAWALLSPVATYVGARSGDSYSAFQGAAYVGLAACCVVGVVASFTVSSLWDRTVLVRRFGDRKVQGRRGDGVAFLVLWLLVFWVVQSSHLPDTFPLASLGDSGWVVEPARIASWWVMATSLFVAGPIIAGRGIRDSFMREPIDAVPSSSKPPPSAS